jgi:Cytochrome P450
MFFQKATYYPFVVGLAASLVVLWRLGKIGRRPRTYPPGPPTLPLIGNLHQIPGEKRHIQFEKWAREYGPIYSLMLGTKVMIVLNSDQVIKDLVDKRGVIYSSRPESYIGQDILSGGLRVLFMVCTLQHVCVLYKSQDVTSIRMHN